MTAQAVAAAPIRAPGPYATTVYTAISATTSPATMVVEHRELREAQHADRREHGHGRPAAERHGRDERDREREADEDVVLRGEVAGQDERQQQQARQARIARHRPLVVPAREPGYHPPEDKRRRASCARPVRDFRSRAVSQQATLDFGRLTHAAGSADTDFSACHRCPGGGRDGRVGRSRRRQAQEPQGEGRSGAPVHHPAAGSRGQSRGDRGRQALARLLRRHHGRRRHLPRHARQRHHRAVHRGRPRQGRDRPQGPPGQALRRRRPDRSDHHLRPRHHEGGRHVPDARHGRLPQRPRRHATRRRLRHGLPPADAVARDPGAGRGRHGRAAGARRQRDPVRDRPVQPQRDRRQGRAASSSW